MFARVIVKEQLMDRSRDEVGTEHDTSLFPYNAIFYLSLFHERLVVHFLTISLMLNDSYGNKL